MRLKTSIAAVAVIVSAGLLAGCGGEDTQIAAMQSQVKKLEAALAAIDKKAGAAQKQAAELKAANTTLKGQVVALQSKIAGIEGQNEKLSTLNAKLSSKATWLEGATAKLDGKTVKLEGKAAELEGVLKKLENNFLNLEGGVTKATSGLEDTKKELVGLKEQWKVPASWNNCEWKAVGEKESRSPSRDWCPAGQFMTAINIEACKEAGQSCPTIAKVRCCSTR